MTTPAADGTRAFVSFLKYPQVFSLISCALLATAFHVTLHLIEDQTSNKPEVKVPEHVAEKIVSQSLQDVDAVVEHHYDFLLAQIAKDIRAFQSETRVRITDCDTDSTMVAEDVVEKLRAIRFNARTESMRWFTFKRPVRTCEVQVDLEEFYKN